MSLSDSLPETLEKGKCLWKEELFPVRPTIPAVQAPLTQMFVHLPRWRANPKVGKSEHLGPGGRLLWDLQEWDSVREENLSLDQNPGEAKTIYPTYKSNARNWEPLHKTTPSPIQTEHGVHGCENWGPECWVQILAPLPSQFGTLFNLSEPQFPHC